MTMFFGVSYETNEEKSNLTRHLNVGKKGEEIAVKHLVKLGFKIIDRNYRQKLGEIDIVAEKNKIIHFVEVKTVSCEPDFDDYIPEENINYSKKKKFARTINKYLEDKRVSYETEFQVDAIALFFNPQTWESKVRFLENIILEE